jgi:hypothetical protein
MLDSKAVTALVRRYSWLVIETPARAVGFLTVIGIVIILAIKLELGSSWNLYAAGTQNEKAGETYQVLLRTIGAAFSSTDGELLIIVGGSTHRELTADDSLVSKILTSKCGRNIHVVNLGSSSQTFSESWDAIALAPDNQKRLILVGINPYRLSFNDEDIVTELAHNRTGIPNSYSLLWNVWLHTGNFVGPERYLQSVARQKSLGARWELMNLFVSRPPVPATRPQDPFQPLRSAYNAPVWTRAQKLKETNEYIATRAIDFQENYRTGVKWYNRLLEHFRTSKSDVKFLVLPTDETFDKANKLMANNFRDALRRLGGDRNILDLRDQKKNLTSADFFDVQHLVARGRAKIQPALVDAFSRALGCASERP